MLGAIVGDIVGSVYEFDNTKSTDFELFYEESCFTDDTVMTLADGGTFFRWIFQDNPQPYNSWGNGAGMRVSPVGLYANTLEETLRLAKITASVSHNHLEGIKGAQAIAASVFSVKKGRLKQRLRNM